MAKQVGDDVDLREAKTVIGITKSRLKQLLVRLRSNATERGEVAEARKELLNIAVDKDHCHVGALRWIENLDKMDAVVRNEKLYHFDLMRAHMGWDESDLLPDRQPVRANVEDGAPALA